MTAIRLSICHVCEYSESNQPGWRPGSCCCTKDGQSTKAHAVSGNCPEGKFEEVNKQMDGLGDIVVKVTTAIGIKPCDSCKKRAQQLNQKTERIFRFVRGIIRRVVQ